MKITSLVENTSCCGLPTEHGLSLHIELFDGRKLLFDMGQSTLFATNANRLGIDLADVGTAFVSHGHYDHGGGLGIFMNINSMASIYLHGEAFAPHYSLHDDGMHFIGLDSRLEGAERLVTCSGTTELGNGLTLISDIDGTISYPPGNRLLFGPTTSANDSFAHEQSLLIREGDKLVLFAGCAHKGIVNIINKAIETTGTVPTHVLAGMHLVKSGMTAEEERTFIAELAAELGKHSQCQYVTMHCTGKEQYEMLHDILGNKMQYLSCGETLEI